MKVATRAGRTYCETYDHNYGPPTYHHEPGRLVETLVCTMCGHRSEGWYRRENDER